METQTVSSFQFPPGVRFHPSDEELIVYYLHKKVNSRPLPAAVIGEVELYSYNPWDLPKKAPFGDEEWYFFSPRDRKYPNGARPNRTAASGYWKATGTDKPILSSAGARIGLKKALVFYIGKPPNGVKTDWTMIEYRLPDTLIRPSRSKGSMRLDDWVLCRIKQKGNMSKNSWEAPQSPTRASMAMGEVSDAKDQFPSSVYSHNPSTTTTTDTTSSGICSNYYLSQDCHLLAKLLATQDFPSIQTDNSSTSRSSNIDHQNCNVQVYDIKENHLHHHHHQGQMNNIPFFAGSFNLLGKHNADGNRYENDEESPPSKKPMINLNKIENAFTGAMAAPNGTSVYDQNQHHGDMCKLNLYNAMPNLQELDVYAFAQRFLQ